VQDDLNDLISKLKIPEIIGEILKANQVEVSMNMLTGRPMIRTSPGRERKILDDNLKPALLEMIKDSGKYSMDVVINRNIKLLAMKNPYHPVCDYLDTLTWDGIPRIDTWLHKYMTAENSPYVRTVGRLFLIAACRRVRHPGCKFDECLVLIGKEGIGKSSGIKALVPNSSLFSDSLPLGQDPKQTVEKTEGVWICESAELVGNSPAKINEIKAFLSRQEDGPYRAAYGTESTTRPRQFVPIATNNDPLFLSSMHGNRRFWPVRVSHCDHESIMADRDQLWAEANIREFTDESIQLPKELWDEAGRQQESHCLPDAWEDDLSDLPAKARLDEIWAKLNVPIQQRRAEDSKRIAGIMQKQGRKRVRRTVNGKKHTFYDRLTPLDEESFDHAPLSAQDQWADDMHSELRADEIAAETEPDEPDVPEGAEWVSAFAQNRPTEEQK